MLITFSLPSLATIHHPLAEARQVEAIRTVLHWKTPAQCRLQILSSVENRAANDATHEAFIRAVFDQDPRATIKTARAIYRGRDDYQRQTKRVSA